MSKILGLSAIALVVFALVMSGCTAQAPDALKPAGPVVTTGQAVHADPPGPVATVTPEPTQLLDLVVIGVSKGNPGLGQNLPYVYERSGKYYLQPSGFVCTDPNPQFLMMFRKSDPNNMIFVTWCER